MITLIIAIISFALLYSPNPLTGVSLLPLLFLDNTHIAHSFKNHKIPLIITSLLCSLILLYFDIPIKKTLFYIFLLHFYHQFKIFIKPQNSLPWSLLFTACALFLHFNQFSFVIPFYKNETILEILKHLIGILSLINLAYYKKWYLIILPLSLFAPETQALCSLIFIHSAIYIKEFKVKKEFIYALPLIFLPFSLMIGFYLTHMVYSFFSLKEQSSQHTFK